MRARGSTQQSEAMSSVINFKTNNEMNESPEATTMHLSQKQNFKIAFSHRPLSFSFSQNSGLPTDLPMFLIFRAVGGIRRVQKPRDICTRFGRFLYYTKLVLIIEMI